MATKDVCQHDRHRDHAALGDRPCGRAVHRRVSTTWTRSLRSWAGAPSGSGEVIKCHTIIHAPNKKAHPSVTTEVRARLRDRLHPPETTGPEHQAITGMGARRAVRATQAEHRLWVQKRDHHRNGTTRRSRHPCVRTRRCLYLCRDAVCIGACDGPAPGQRRPLSQASPELRSEASAALWLQQIDPMANAGHRLDPAVR